MRVVVIKMSLAIANVQIRQKWFTIENEKKKNYLAGRNPNSWGEEFINIYNLKKYEKSGGHSGQGGRKSSKGEREGSNDNKTLSHQEGGAAPDHQKCRTLSDRQRSWSVIRAKVEESDSHWK